MYVYCNSHSNTFESIAYADSNCKKDQDWLSFMKFAHFMFIVCKTSISFPLSNQALQILYFSKLLFVLKKTFAFNLSPVYQVSVEVHILKKEKKKKVYGWTACVTLPTLQCHDFNSIQTVAIFIQAHCLATHLYAIYFNLESLV